MNIQILITDPDLTESIAVTQRMVIDEICEKFNQQSAVLVKVLNNQENDIIVKSYDNNWIRYNNYKVKGAKYDTVGNKINVTISYKKSNSERRTADFYCNANEISIIKEVDVLGKIITQIIDL